MTAIKKKSKPIPRGRDGGRKPKYSEPTETIAFRVPVSKVKEVKVTVANLVAGWVK